MHFFFYSFKHSMSKTVWDIYLIFEQQVECCKDIRHLSWPWLDSKVKAMKRGESQMDLFCLMMALHWEGTFHAICRPSSGIKFSKHSCYITADLRMLQQLACSRVGGVGQSQWALPCPLRCCSLLPIDGAALKWFWNQNFQGGHPSNY